MYGITAGSYLITLVLSTFTIIYFITTSYTGPILPLLHDYNLEQVIRAQLFKTNDVIDVIS